MHAPKYPTQATRNRSKTRLFFIPECSDRESRGAGPVSRRKIIETDGSCAGGLSAASSCAPPRHACAVRILVVGGRVLPLGSLRFSASAVADLCASSGPLASPAHQFWYFLKRFQPMTPFFGGIVENASPESSTGHESCLSAVAG